MINLYPPYVVGGNEMITHDLVEALRGQGHEVHVLTAQGGDFDGVPYVHQVFNYDLDQKDRIFGGHQLPLMEIFRHHVFDLTTYRNVRRAVGRLDPDLVVVDNQYMVSAAPLLAVRDAPCPVIAQTMDKWLVYNLVDLSMIVKPSSPARRLFSRAACLFVQRSIARYVRLDGIATVSNFIRDFYVEAGFDPEMMQSVYLGYDSTVFRPRPPQPLHDPVRLIYAGALWKGKGPQVIVKALGILNEMEGAPCFRLRIFGEGTERFTRYLQGVIEASGVEEQVSLRGFVPWSDLVEAMHASDIFVFSSIWDEPFATVPLQAAGCGLPVVATRAGGTPEGFVDGETALLIPPDDAPAMADAILRLARDSGLREEIAQRAAQDAQERWTFDAYVNRFWNFCMSVRERWQQGTARS
jgi:glycosyltransferase involved in cell wall biosynthesis